MTSVYFTLKPLRFHYCRFVASITQAYTMLGASRWLGWYRIWLQCRRPGFSSWVGKTPWRREWLPIPIFLPGEFHRQRSPGGYSLWGCKESDTTERLTFTFYNAYCLSDTVSGFGDTRMDYVSLYTMSSGSNKRTT